ncbi:MAG: ATP-binding cassette domain-containing protein [Chitinophagales bacterium]|nr:ATP-binding cassette domain-containing protein [Chitinophagales bacterium]
MSTVIKVENVSKVYNLGTISSGTLAEDVNRMVARAFGKEDPLRKVTHLEANSNIHIALRDVSFDVKDGEVLGIIGKNGAGKSTLLKILSRITAPTSGAIKMKGRVASLLEVGTGFHPELSGRENIFLNGAILGMTRNEVARKFDEIVDFSGVEKFIDTPVKRYSSGMYVRLAFAVAAHLEPEILIVDEVLAVGDADFQKKCLGKMKDVSANQGRTVLFVSHNMTAVKNLCNRGIFLRQGQILQSGTADEVVAYYQSHEFNDSFVQSWEYETAPGNDKIKAKSVKAIPYLKPGQDAITPDTAIDIEYEFWNEIDDTPINLSLFVNNISGEPIFNIHSPLVKLNKGLHKGVCKIPPNLLNDELYTISIMTVQNLETMLFNMEHIVSFEVVENREATGWHGKWPGYVRPQLDFTLQ